jgi:hypothetical protein
MKRRKLKTDSIALALMAVAIAAQNSFAAPSKPLSDGIALFNQGKYMESLGLFNQAKSTDSDNPMLHYYMASALMKLNQKADAIREYKMTMALDAGGKLAAYSEAALRTLEGSAVAPKGKSAAATTGGASPAAASKSGGPKQASGRSHSAPPSLSEPTKVEADQTPQVITVLCGCPLCHRVELMVTDLNTKYGDKIEFHRTMQNAGDDKTKALISKYSIHTCPTVLLIGNRGATAHEFKGMISERDLTREVDELARLSATTRLSTIENKFLNDQRKLIVDEVDSRVSHDQIRVNQAIKQLQADAAAEQELIPKTDPDRSMKIELTRTEVERQSKFLREDFERRKKEWYAAAEARIKAVESTAGGRKTASPSLK